MEDLSPTALANVRPVLALTQVGGANSEHALKELMNKLQDVLARQYQLIPYEAGQGPSAGSGNTSVPGSRSIIVGEEWLQKYLYGLPAMILVLAPLPGVGDDEMDIDGLASAINSLQYQSHERGQRLVIILQPATMDTTTISMSVIQDRRDRLARLTRLPVSCIFVISGNDTTGSVPLTPIVQYVGQQYGHFYRERLKKYRRKQHQQLQPPQIAGSDNSLASGGVYSNLRYQFKAGLMELFLGEPDSALKSFNSAYASVIQHCRRIPAGNEDTTLLPTVRWICDVIALKIVWILMSRGDRRDADEYFAGHMAWFAGSHAISDGQALVTWKCQLYESMSHLAQAATRPTSREVASPTSKEERSFAQEGPSEGRSAAYYAYLAAKNAISLQTLLLDQEQRQSLATNKVLPLLALTYDQYHRQPGHDHSMTLQLSRLISSQYLLLGDLDEAKGYFSRNH